MDRVDVNTGEVVTFEVPDEIYWVGSAVVSFLDADTLLYVNYDKQDDEKEEEKKIKIYLRFTGSLPENGRI